MYAEPEVWNALMEKLADTFAAYVAAQARAGADLVQLFDSWVGSLSPANYSEFVAPWSARILAAVAALGVPTIHFGTGTSALLSTMVEAGGDVIGLDWRIPLDEGWALVGEERGVQGNLDPATLLGPWRRVEAGARDILARAAGRPGHIFPTSVMACFRAPIQTCSAACASSSTPKPHAEESHTFGAVGAQSRHKGHLALRLPCFLFPFGWVGLGWWRLWCPQPAERAAA